MVTMTGNYQPPAEIQPTSRELLPSDTSTQLTQRLMGVRALTNEVCTAYGAILANQRSMQLLQKTWGNNIGERNNQLASVHQELAAAINNGSFSSTDEMLNTYLLYKHERTPGFMDKHDLHLPSLIQQLQPGVPVLLLPTTPTIITNRQQLGAGTLVDTPNFSLNKHGHAHSQKLTLDIVLDQQSGQLPVTTHDSLTIAAGDNIPQEYADQMQKYIERARCFLARETASEQLLLPVPHPDAAAIFKTAQAITESLFRELPEIAESPLVQEVSQQLFAEIKAAHSL